MRYYIQLNLIIGLNILCLFSVHLGVHCQTLFCSVSFLVLSFKADLKRTDAVQRVLDRRVCLSDPDGLPGWVVWFRGSYPHVEMSLQWVCGSRGVQDAPCCYCGLAPKVLILNGYFFQGVHL